MPRRQRADRVLLALLVALGILGMHGTPAMAGSPVSQSGGQPAMADHAIGTTAGGSHLADAVLPTSAIALPSGGHDQPPAEHHLLAPCLSNAAPAIPIGGHAPGLAEVSLSRATVRAGGASRTAALDLGRPSPPPDLQKLCISRT